MKLVVVSFFKHVKAQIALIGGDDSLMAIPKKQQNSNSTPTADF
jgi:hypothetical protein